MLRMMLILSRKAISFLENHRTVDGSCMIFQCSQIRGGISRNEKRNGELLFAVLCTLLQGIQNKTNEEGEKSCAIRGMPL